MHIIDYQYLNVITTKQNDTEMHDLKTIYDKVESTLKTRAKEYFAYGGNSRFYPNEPKLTDLEIVSLAITSECLQIDSENLLWSKIETDYSKMFELLPHRTSYNRRKRRLADLISGCNNRISDILYDQHPDDTLIVDSMPIAVCKIARERSSTVCRNEERDEVVARKGKNIIMNGWFIGYKLHLITTSTGIYRDIKTTQLRLFEEVDIRLSVPYRRNQKDFKKYDFVKKIKRKQIEVVFSQLCDEFMIRRNYAKTFEGFYARIVSKLAAKSFKQFWNLKNNSCRYLEGVIFSIFLNVDEKCS